MDRWLAACPPGPARCSRSVPKSNGAGLHATRSVRTLLSKCDLGDAFTGLSSYSMPTQAGDELGDVSPQRSTHDPRAAVAARQGPLKMTALEQRQTDACCSSDPTSRSRLSHQIKSQAWHRPVASGSIRGACWSMVGPSRLSESCLHEDALHLSLCLAVDEPHAHVLARVGRDMKSCGGGPRFEVFRREEGRERSVHPAHRSTAVSHARTTASMPRRACEHRPAEGIWARATLCFQ